MQERKLDTIGVGGRVTMQVLIGQSDRVDKNKIE